MDAAGIKVQLKRLMDQRGALEAEIAVRSGRLEAAGVGMHGALVDAEVSCRLACLRGSLRVCLCI